MSRYEHYSREELLNRIEELESGELSEGRFRERYARKILDSLPDMLTVLSHDGRVVELVSADETNHVGVEGPSLVGSHISDLLDEESYRNVRENLDNVFESGRGSNSNHNITLDGHTLNYENRILPLSDQYALCICRDITQEKAAKRELEMVKFALNNVDEEVYACRLDGTMEYANDLFRQHHQIEGDILNYKVYDFWAQQSSRENWLIRLDAIRRDNGHHKYTVRLQDNNDQQIVWDVMSYLLYDDNLKQELVWFMGRDVTQSYDQEAKLKEMNSIMESVLNNVPVYLFVKDPGNEFRYLYWNRAFAEYSGIPAERALGHTDFEIFPNPRDAEKFRDDDLALLRSGENVAFVEEYISAVGETRIVNTSKALVPVENRMPLIIGVSWDITDMKAAEMEIIEARIRAEESDRLKSAFLANMSHEIRTPLNAIIGFAKLFSAAETEEEKQQFTDIIDTNSEVLLQLINDILDLSKIEAGTLSFNFKQMDLNELCRSECETLRGRTKPGVELIYDEKPISASIVCDQNRLAQVITNLINNAAKFTEQGHIRFGFDLVDDRVEFYVEDTGIGIAQDKLKTIFDRFIKLNDFASGTGLGLSITKMILEKLDGSLSVESEEGKGTRFHFSIPMICSAAGAETSDVVATSDPIEGSWSLLVAEDSEINYKLVEALLGRRFALLKARTGKEAVELFERHRPDAVLMNLRLPVMDGLEATRRIRQIDGRVPVIGMSAYAFSEEVKAAREAGCNDFLPKPLSQQVLRKTLNAYLIKKRE